MSLIGFGVRRVLKAGANTIIDNFVDDPETAKVLKTVTGIGITAIGIGISIATADPVGVGDAVLDAGDTIASAGEVVADHATGVVVDHGIGTIADHGSTFVETGHHVASTTDIKFGFGNGDYGTASDGTPVVYEDASGYGWSWKDGAGDRYQKKFGVWDPCP